MKKPAIQTIFLMIIITLAACKKEEPTVIVADNMNVIRGKIIDDSIHWKINNTTIQPVRNSWQRIDADSSNKNIKKSVFAYEHTDAHKPVNMVKVISPAFDIKTPLEDKKMIFALGKHSFNDQEISALEGYAIEVLYNDEWISSANGSQENKSFEIIDTEYITDKANPEKYVVARTLISINCNLYDSAENYKGEIKGLLMNAEFMLEKE